MSDMIIYSIKLKFSTFVVLSIVGRYHNICDRNITKFVTEKYLKEVPDRKKSAEECVAVVRERIQAYGKDCLWNADQNGFEYEMRPGRTLDFVGAKHVFSTHTVSELDDSQLHCYDVRFTRCPQVFARSLHHAARTKKNLRTTCEKVHV
ncbi:hypothetical protein RvY_01296-2 [Ramazzottius varieornatus]|uniref:Uncharacterized protein n=1 Tax=Ramazzottius varieornatus TaxID=947166 RepID=A0A1D1UFS7_RAMVA|nr:hypothetical protein RvY_01296-2 [Ramazzottius varieornatus]